jgi:hypothetical protein
MKEPTSSANGAHSDTHDHVAVVTFARAAVTILNSVAVLWLVLIEYLLIRMNCSKSKFKPNPTETQLGLLALLIAHRELDYTIFASAHAILRRNWGQENAAHLEIRRGEAHVLAGASWTWWSSLALLVWAILVTWLIFKATIMSISAVPRIKDAYHDPQLFAIQTPLRRAFHLPTQSSKGNRRPHQWF